MNSLGLYIHIPYCVHKCGYCDFNSHPVNHGETSAYVAALVNEMAHRAQGTENRPRLHSIFLGGGTPTTLPPASLEAILEACGDHFTIDPDCEITVEANPATLTPDALKTLRRSGVNRISVGVQSFDADELRLLERIHDVADVHRTVAAIKEAGFDNFSLDLMFALPGQSLETWEGHLNKALAFDPPHLSTYNLTIEPGTAFHRLHEQGKLTMPPEEHQLALYKKTLAVLKDAGYEHYEISNFGKPGFACRHNLTYWHNGDTLGLGAGAVSHLGGARFKNTALPSHYIRDIEQKGEAVEFAERLKPRQAMGETLMLGLRLLDGVPIDAFERRFGTSFDAAYGDTVRGLEAKNLITREGGRLALSPEGLYLADSVILEFIEAD